MWLEAALLILLVLLQAGSFALLWYQGRRLRRDLITQANNVPALLTTSTLGKIEHRLDALDERLRRIDERSRSVTRTLPLTPAPAPTGPVQHAVMHNYELAQQLAREGSALEVLMERCGLSRNEAELVQRLYADRS
ncbi:DUF2802 domain-containing protein [Rhodanobacter sp. K2T2]|uniref:DUF2802 domain-containing protein n=1 Tax=Rhodanobacter sp. K2T2 TaxID=2723085 RepID=UPI0031F30257